MCVCVFFETMAFVVNVSEVYSGVRKTGEAVLPVRCVLCQFGDVSLCQL